MQIHAGNGFSVPIVGIWDEYQIEAEVAACEAACLRDIEAEGVIHGGEDGSIESVYGILGWKDSDTYPGHPQQSWANSPDEYPEIQDPYYRRPIDEFSTDVEIEAAYVRQLNKIPDLLRTRLPRLQFVSLGYTFKPTSMRIFDKSHPEKGVTLTFSRVPSDEEMIADIDIIRDDLRKYFKTFIVCHTFIGNNQRTNTMAKKSKPLPKSGPREEKAEMKGGKKGKKC